MITGPGNRGAVAFPRTAAVANTRDTTATKPRAIPRWAWGVGLLVALTSMVLVANVNGPSLPFDDAYIAFAYAAHLATGHGLRLSIGSAPVEGFSDPLWVGVLAVGHLVGVAIPTWARIINLVLVWALGAGAALLTRRVNPGTPWWMALGVGTLLALLPATVYDAVGGLETLLFATLFVGVLVGHHGDWRARRPTSAATTVGCVLLALTRPEGIVVWVLVWSTSWAWIRQPRRQLRAAAGFAIPMLVVEAARLVYFGQLLPNSVIAKGGQSWSVAAHLVHLEVVRFATEYPILVTLALSGLVVAAVCRHRYPHLAVLAPPVAALALTEIALSSGDNYPYERYLFPLLAPAVVIAVGLLSAFAYRSAALTSPAGIRIGVSALVAAMLAGSWVVAYNHQEPGTTTGQMLAVSRGLSRVPSLFSVDRLAAHDKPYEYALATFLRRRGQPGETVATDEIGTVAYYTDLRVIDLYGLANAHIAHLPGPPGVRADPNYVFDHHPSFFVITGGAEDRAYLSDPRMRAYHVVAKIPDLSLNDHLVRSVTVLERR